MTHVGLNVLIFLFLFSYFFHILHEIRTTLLCLKAFSTFNCFSHLLNVFPETVYSMANHRYSNIVQIIQILFTNVV